MAIWTVEETRLLQKYYNQLPNPKLKQLFPGRSMSSIYWKAQTMGLRKDPNMAHINRSQAKWKGGVYAATGGYRMVMRPGHPRANSKGYVYEHILVWEKETGTRVPKNCCIHHLNGNKQDNRIENLCVMLRSAHSSLHHTNHKCSEETRKLLSERAKERFKDKRNHPLYKDVDVNAMLALRSRGMSIEEVCRRFDISKHTYYKRVRELREKGDR